MFAVARLLLWSGLVLVFLAANGGVSAHETMPHHRGLTVFGYSASAIDHDADTGDHGSANDQNCAHHAGGGCGTQWAFTHADAILPIARTIAWVSFENIVQDSGPPLALEHPPKSDIKR